MQLFESSPKNALPVFSAVNQGVNQRLFLKLGFNTHFWKVFIIKKAHSCNLEQESLVHASSKLNFYFD